MPKLLSDQIIQAIEQAEELYRRLILLIAATSSGKTAALQEKPLLTIEVKADWALSPKSKTYIEQAYGYAQEVGTRFVIITNGDRYVVFDRARRLDYASNLIGEFQVTRLTRSGLDILESLRRERLGTSTH